ncbi:MAG TPA: hypothetical protein VI451_08430, partial [Anaerolineales bacterium]|nr:hypothetical protein [Anaerolineales bacterium]
MKTLSRNLLLLLIGVLFIVGQSPLTTHEATASSQPTRFVRANDSEPDRPIAAPGDEFWDGRFNVLGVNGYVRAIAVSGTDVYVGGLFNSVGGVAANNIARWSSVTGTWSALGAGVSSTVLSIAVSGSDVYVGGYFFAAGGIPSVPGTQGIARWNNTTSTWSALGAGVPGYVYAIAVNGIDVYAGGLFNAAGGVGASNIAKYNATTNTWSALGNGTGYKVFALAVSGSDVYVGGYFSAAGNVPGTQSVARWNNVTQTWSALGSGIGGYVYALAVSGDDVYVGGLFNAVNGFPSVPNTHNIARWNSSTSTWSALGSGVSSYVYSLAASGDDVYVGGLFNAAGGAANTHNIARWDGSSWSALGSGVGGYVYGIAVGADGVYAGGLFNAAGDEASHNFGLWHGNILNPPDPRDVYWDDRFGTALTFGTFVADIAVNGEDVYVGGNFYVAGGLGGTRGIAKWNSPAGTWSSVGNGINNGRVEAIALSGNNVYIGGQFEKVYGSPGNFIARWDGNSWSDLGGGVNGTVYDIEISGNDVYVLGSFSSAGGQNANQIARWNSTTGEWSPLGSGAGFGANHMAILSDGSVLVAGTLNEAGGVPVNYVARWDGSNWTAFGSGLTCCVATIEVSGSTVYIGGSFNKLDGAVVNFLAMGTGTGWTQVGSDLNGTVTALTFSSSAIYVGGSFSIAGEVSANR